MQLYYAKTELINDQNVFFLKKTPSCNRSKEKTGGWIKKVEN